MIEAGVGDPGVAHREIFEGLQGREVCQSLIADVGLPEIKPLQFPEMGEVDQAGTAHRGAFQGQVGQGLVATEENEVFIAESGGSVECYFGHLSGLGALKDMPAQSCDFTGWIPGGYLWLGVGCK